MNITTTHFDLPRYVDNDDLKQALRQFDLDGVELMEGGADELGIIQPDDVVGAHLKYFVNWVSLWRGDDQVTLKEYDNWETCREVFGGINRDAIIQACLDNISFLAPYQPRYGVLHVADVSIEGSITRNFVYSDEEVIDTTIELVNTVFTDLEHPFTLLFENLAWSGMDMTDPGLVYRLLESVRYPDCGVMIDIGHLLQTNMEIRTPDEGIDYIHSVLDLYENLDFIKGIHLHQTLSGEYAEGMLANPVIPVGDYQARSLEIMSHILTLDSHRPFISERVEELVDRINSDYLVFELISSSREEHEQMLREQLKCFSPT
jgi:hypothetical protein